MSNPWKNIDLDDYENHMKIDTVGQLQSLNEIMSDQFYRYKTPTVMILGIAGGNGLNHIDPSRFRIVFGVDINPDYLTECQTRYPELCDVFKPIEGDLANSAITLPHADMVIANLLIEYIGCENFQNTIKGVMPPYVSCVIQKSTGVNFVSDSPYACALNDLDSLHQDIHESDLTTAMTGIGYMTILKQEIELPNRKAFCRLDFQNNHC
ncbi:class I SAM-dependent methyltransferase [Caproiciproducens galactitolivorans]|uniref:class I SAM-dependent methyltransferase n=1 Tax=Caproiciproducens galactitolivorans TaxID=642589 RepID=UPI00240984C3|nr:class I SAM-dependent methyltransferase [Caproiciproducens galactitolivorans]